MSLVPSVEFGLNNFLKEKTIVVSLPFFSADLLDEDFESIRSEIAKWTDKISFEIVIQSHVGARMPHHSIGRKRKTVDSCGFDEFDKNGNAIRLNEALNLIRDKNC